jgi:hypothetical protein
MAELTRLDWDSVRQNLHFRQTENERTTIICRTKKAWQAPQSLYQFRYLITVGRRSGVAA